MSQSEKFNPLENLAAIRREFGEHGGVNMSVESSSTFTVLKSGTMPDIFAGKIGPEQGGCYLYGRHFNPTVHALSCELAAIEGTQSAYCTASGLSAIAAVIFHCCDHGDHIISSNAIYGGTHALLNEFLPVKSDIETTFVDVTNYDAIEEAFTEKTRLLFLESISNPTLIVADIPRLAEIAHRHNALLVIDNTFSPMILSPRKLGADIIVHSLTKFINGSSDIIGGAICADRDLIHGMIDLHMGPLMLLGPTMDPRVAFQVSMRLPHLGIRMTEHSRRAMYFAQRLAELDLQVSYPGLQTHTQYDILKRDMNPEFGFGGIFTLDLGTQEKAYKFMDALQNDQQFGLIAVSLGYFDSLISCSASSTSSELSDEDLAYAGISQGLVRISIGYTGTVQQRWNQFENAMKAVELI
ncbi:MAG: aminotransferase class I/II-fold pyridoxal phosphate-dependent enzyme [Candidatus Atribacteria bacterium]|nr:MAG: aminotransferase class I/II-fold pyridoxal phosphate-dependent enzyme [Candidatus Atribacteria bacterium]